VNNRILLLNALQDQFGHFDRELLKLLRKAYPETAVSLAQTSLPVAGSGRVALDSTPVNVATNLLGVGGLLAEGGNHSANDKAKLLLTGRVLEGFLEASGDASAINEEIIAESQVMNRMVRNRDKMIEFTNIANFYQIGILGVISDSLGLPPHSSRILAGNEVNLVSGPLVAFLAVAALVERHGGFRPSPAEPNMLGTMFGINTEKVRLSPLMSNYLDTLPPSAKNGMTRRQDLLKYWQEAKVINVDTKRDSIVQKLSAEGAAHKWWSENINLMNNRIFMLWDLRAILRSSNICFDELLTSVN
jgi:hypothetical protein